MKPRLLVQLLAGALFGAGLAISGMLDPARVIGFLDLAGDWDPALIGVMGGAVVTFGGGMLLRRRMAGGRGWFGRSLPCATGMRIDHRLFIGALVFGAGWGLSGFCPGPGLANLAALRAEALVFAPAMAVGMLLARTRFGADRE